jgi:hypothetical protein
VSALKLVLIVTLGIAGLIGCVEVKNDNLDEKQPTANKQQTPNQLYLQRRLGKNSKPN